MVFVVIAPRHEVRALLGHTERGTLRSAIHQKATISLASLGPDDAPEENLPCTKVRKIVVTVAIRPNRSEDKTGNISCTLATVMMIKLAQAQTEARESGRSKGSERADFKVLQLSIVNSSTSFVWHRRYLASRLSLSATQQFVIERPDGLDSSLGREIGPDSFPAFRRDALG